VKIVKFIIFWVILILLILLSFYSTKVLFAKGYSGEFIGAFLGAFFAAVSVILYEIFLKYRDKEVGRVNDLILYELELNACMRILSDAIFQIEKRTERKDTEQFAAIHHISLEQLVLSFEPITGVRHIGIKNELLSLHGDFSKINTDLSNLMIVYKSNVQMITSSSADMPSKIKQLGILNSGLKKELEYFHGFLKETQDEVVDCVAGIRIITRWDKPSLPKHIYRYFTGWEYDEMGFAIEKKTERDKLLEEIKQVQEQSGKKIDKAKQERLEVQ